MAEFEFTPIGAEDVIKALTSIDARLKDVAESSRQTGQQGEAATTAQTDGWGNLSEKVTAGVTAFRAAYDAISKVVEVAIDFASEMDRISDVMGAFTGDIGNAEERLGGMVSRLDLMLASNRATQAGLQLTGQELANIAVAAKQFADANDRDVSQSIDQLITALIGGRALGLKPFNLAMSEGADRAQGLRDVLGQLNERVGETTLTADSVGDQFDITAAQWENLKIEFAVGLGSVEGLGRALVDLAAAITGVDDVSQLLATGATGESWIVVYGRTSAAIVQTLIEYMAAGARATKAWATLNFDELASVLMGLEGFDARVTAIQRAATAAAAEARAQRIASRGDRPEEGIPFGIDIPSDFGLEGAPGAGGRGQEADDLERILKAQELEAIAKQQLIALAAEQDMAERARIETLWEQRDAERVAHGERMIEAEVELELQRVIRKEDEEAAEAKINSDAEARRRKQDEVKFAEDIAGSTAQIGSLIIFSERARLKENAKRVAISEAWEAAIEVAKGVATLFVPGAQAESAAHFLAAKLHGAVALAAGGVSIVASGGGGGGGRSEPSARPERGIRDGQQQAEGKAPVTYIINHPFPEAEIGRLQARFANEHTARYGAAA